jgi:hypothetical protein
MLNRVGLVSSSVLVLLLGSGCSDIPLGGNPADDAALRTLAGQGAPKLGRLAVAPVSSFSLADDESRKWNLNDAPMISAFNVQTDICRALGATASYDNVRQAGPAAAEEAWKFHDDYLATIAVSNIRTHWDGHASIWPVNVGIFCLWWPFSYWVGDFEFSLTADVTVTVTSAESGQILPDGKKTLEVKTNGTFDQIDRGFHIFGILYTEFEGAEWRGIAEQLWPNLQCKLSVAVARQVETILRATTKSEASVEKVHKKTLLLSVGVSRYLDTNTYPPLDYAAEDARKIASVFEHGGVAREHIRTLVDGEATVKTFQDAVKDHLGRAREGDSVVVFAACYGTRLEDGRPGLVLNESAAGRDDGRISLDEVAQALGSVHGARLVLFDCGFGGHGRFIARAGVQPKDDTAPFESRSVAALFAGGPDEPALAPEHLGMGLFSFYLLKGLEGKADLDHDGRLPAQELYQFVRPRVIAEAAYLGGEMEAPRGVALDRGPVLDIVK